MQLISHDLCPGIRLWLIKSMRWNSMEGISHRNYNDGFHFIIPDFCPEGTLNEIKRFEIKSNRNSTTSCACCATNVRICPMVVLLLNSTNWTVNPTLIKF